MLVGFAACNGPSETDPRDVFVGAYAYEATGNIEFDLAPLHWDIPLNEQGILTISKVGDKDKVVIKGYNDSIEASVSGNQLILENNTYNTNYGDIELQLTFLYGKATLTDRQLTWETDVKGIGRYSSYSAVGEGHVSMVANKQ